MFGRLAKHRRFEYTPVYYDPEKEEKERGRPRIHFRRMHRKARAKPFIWLLAMLIFVVYLIIILGKIAYNY